MRLCNRSPSSTPGAAAGSAAAIPTTAAIPTNAASSATATRSASTAGSAAPAAGSKSCASASAARPASYSNATRVGAARTTGQRKQNALLGFETSGNRYDRNIAGAQAARHVQIDLINTGARQSHESRQHEDVIDVEADRVVHRSRARKRSSRRNKRSGGPEPETEKFNIIAGLRRNRSQNIVGAIAPDNDSRNIIYAIYFIQAESRRKFTQGHVRSRAARRGLNHH